MNLRTLKKWKPFIIHAAVVGVLLLAIGLMITIGEKHFEKEFQEQVSEEFINQFRAFYVPLTHYLVQPSFILGLAAALLFYTWMLSSLIYKYFNMFKIGQMFDIMLCPRAIESIPHALIILTIFYAFLKNAGHLRSIMMIPFLVISIPFIYKMLEDAFITAEKQGVIENYLVLPIPDWKIIISFLKQKAIQVIVIPLAFFIILMVYWEFLYSSIGIIVDRKSAPAVFYTNYNDAILKNYPQAHDFLILLQIGIFTASILILLYLVYITRGAKTDNTAETGRAEDPLKKKTSHLTGNLPLVTCENLTVKVKPKTGEQDEEDEEKNIIIKNINLTIARKENFCIMGESGSGKTTLVNAIAGNLPKDLLIESRPISPGDDPYIFSVFQDVDLYLDPYQTLFSYVKKAFKKRYRNSPAADVKIDNFILVKYIHEIGLLKPLLEDLKIRLKHKYDAQQVHHALVNNRQTEIDHIAEILIQGLKNKKRQKLSGGEKQKFFLLIAFIANPDILIADEIFTDIDSTSRASIANLLFQKDYTVIFISHDIGMVKELMENGKLHKVFYLKDKEFHKEVWISPGDKKPEYASMPLWAEEMHQAYQRLVLEKYRNPSPHANLTPLFEMGNLTRLFDDGSKVNFLQENQKLILYKGVNYTLVGENGAGKTTLFKILTKLVKYKKGTIFFFNGKTRELRKVSRCDFAGQNQLVFQKTGNAIIEETTIKEYLLSFFKKNERKIHELKINELSKEFFKEKWEKILASQFKELSVGEQRRILLIRALLLVKPDGILFVDEAMRGMDIILKDRMVKYLKKEKLQVLLISHDKHLRDALCEKEIRLFFDKKTGNTIVSTGISSVKPGMTDIKENALQITPTDTDIVRAKNSCKFDNNAENLRRQK